MSHPYNALHTFHLAIRFKSLKTTADFLHLTESAVSHQLKRLEAQLGYALFYKSGRQLKPTLEGQRLSNELAAPFDHIDQILSSVSDTPRPLTIYCLPSLIEPWLLPRLLAFKEKQPNHEFIINYLSSAPDYLDEYSLRIGSHEKHGRSVYLSTRILSGETIPVCSPIYLTRFTLPVSNQDMLKADLLHDNNPDSWQAWFATQGLKLSQPPRLLYEDFHLLKMATIAAQGIALCPKALIEDDLASGTLVSLSPHKGNLGRYYAIERNKYAHADIVDLFQHLT
ncbi:LysR family transcriptional regulator [Marinomonas pollencensis]|uniref:LysR family glycine cleavage system transcriptional activator n=1 Tax=Marinomonas pollencensis TaxID=491954 RepID=A0A3E0DEP4_9GAMM|nr:LysR family transcriptional regulator [Marinomonas pollencensis]REG81053.1 LysR family glycine cleavage system transcriptional activator [Marinomonas pollencensis]